MTIKKAILVFSLLTNTLLKANPKTEIAPKNLNSCTKYDLLKLSTLPTLCCLHVLHIFMVVYHIYYPLSSRVIIPRYIPRKHSKFSNACSRKNSKVSSDCSLTFSNINVIILYITKVATKF